MPRMVPSCGRQKHEKEKERYLAPLRQDDTFSVSSSASSACQDTACQRTAESERTTEELQGMVDGEPASWARRVLVGLRALPGASAGVCRGV